MKVNMNWKYISRRFLLYHLVLIQFMITGYGFPQIYSHVSTNFHIHTLISKFVEGKNLLARQWSKQTEQSPVVSKPNWVLPGRFHLWPLMLVALPAKTITINFLTVKTSHVGCTISTLTIDSQSDRFVSLIVS